MCHQMDRVPDKHIEPRVGLRRPQVQAVVEAADVVAGVSVDCLHESEAGGVALLPRAMSERHPEAS